MLSELWLPHVAYFLDITYGLLFMIMLMLLCLWSSRYGYDIVPTVVVAGTHKLVTVLVNGLGLR